MGECEEPDHTREPKITSKSRLRQPTKLIVADSFGLTDEEFETLIANWIVPQLIDTFITQKRTIGLTEPIVPKPQPLSEP
jgi:hypothetical protein